jgi:HEAT repeat protein
MCARVAIARKLPFASELALLLTDEVARVRAMAARALGELGEYEEAIQVKALLTDPEVEVRRAAGNSVRELAKRLDRPIE